MVAACVDHLQLIRKACSTELRTVTMGKLISLYVHSLEIRNQRQFARRACKTG